MPKFSPVQDLATFRERIREERRIRLELGTAIYIGMGTCGIAAGARETMQAIQAELARRGIEAQVGGVGCLGMCAKEPLVDIQQAGKMHMLYGNITPDMVPRLIEEHLLKGQPVKEWVVCRMSRD